MVGGDEETGFPAGGSEQPGRAVGFAVEDFTELQWVTSRSTPRHFPF
jgi:hypothetical protein